MVLSFREQFAQGIIGDLENGRYGSAVDFATGITGHYMRSLSFNIPAAIPPTLPSPAQSGAPAPVGPAVPISTRTRERLFYNTIKTYYLGKEIASGKVQVRTLIEDVNLAIRSYKKAVDKIRSIQQQIQDLDDKIVALQQDLKSIKPELKKFIESKKNIIKSVIDEVSTIGERFQQADPTFDFKTLFQQELNDLLFFKNLKIQPSLNPLEIKATFVELIGLLNKAIGIGNKYKNTFTKEANLKAYIAKKVRTAITEIVTILNAFLSPEQYISYWKEFLYVPNGKRIATIILRIIDNNVFLKEKKRKLYADLERWKAEAQAKLSKKIDELQGKLEERVEALKNNLILKNKRSKERVKLGKKLKQTVADIKNKIKQLRRVLKHTQLVYKGIIALAQNVLKIYTEIKNNIQKTKDLVALIKEKYTDIKTAADESKSPEARQRVKQAKDIFNESFSIENVAAIEDFGSDATGALPIVSEILAAIEKAFQLDQRQIKAFVRIPSKSVLKHISDVDRILTKDIPRLIQLFKLDPTDPNYDARLRAIENQTAVEGVATIVGLGDGENTHKGYLFLVSKLRTATARIQELQLKVEAKLQLTKSELTEQSAEQDAVLDYVNTFIETNPKIKKVANKKREKESEIAEIKEKVYKLKKVAEYAKLAFRLLTDGYEVIKAVTTSPTKPISSSESSLRRFIQNFFKWQMMRGKLTAVDAESQRQQADIKIRDLAVYETLFAFLQEFVKSIKVAKDKGAKGLMQEFKEKLGEKWESLEDGIKAQFETLLGIIDGDQPLTLESLLRIPDALFYQTNVITSLVRAQSSKIRRFRRKIEQLPESIPQDTKDPFLLWIRKQLKKPNDIVLLFVRIVKTMFKKVTEFMEPYISPVVDYIKDEIDEVKVKIQERARERAEKKLESKVNADAKVMSFMFNLAGKLYWLGASWTSPVGTKYIVTSVGKFFPIMKANNVDGAEGIGREMAAGFDNQLRLMQGIAIPNPSYAIPPFPWTGYLPAPAPFPPSLPPTFDDTWSARFA
jgi:hypothetical protein